MAREGLPSFTLKAFDNSAQGCPTGTAAMSGGPGYPGLRSPEAREPCMGSTRPAESDSPICATPAGLNSMIACRPRVARHAGQLGVVVLNPCGVLAFVVSKRFWMPVSSCEYSCRPRLATLRRVMSNEVFARNWPATRPPCPPLRRGGEICAGWGSLPRVHGQFRSVLRPAVLRTAHLEAREESLIHARVAHRRDGQPVVGSPTVQPRADQDG
jgi:hypothetical protein